MKATKSRKLLPKPKPWKIARILVPVDFSQPSELALSHACSLAIVHHAAVTVCHVGEALNPNYGFDTSLLEREIIEGAQQSLLALVGRYCTGIKVETEMRFGRPVETILIAAQKLKSNLIVIGTHGHTGLAHMLLGSVAERIARHATCPVLIVR